MTEKHRLYAMTHSLYSGRARSYLIKHDIPFEELSTGHESFKSDVLPKGKLPTIPTLVTVEGDVIRDGAAIIEHFEVAAGRPCQPIGPKQRVISALFDVLGSDGLLRPAMHYRWNFPEDNLDFVRYHFLHSQRDTPAREEKTDAMMNRMRHAGMIFGVTEQNHALIEHLYVTFLGALNTHFEHCPYLLGWRPCVGDFGLLGPLYAHLGRDPHPARLMQQRAPRVYRWVERMNRADDDTPDYLNPESGFLAHDDVPETLLAVLRVLAMDFVPETCAAAARINRWLAERQPETGTAAVGRLAESAASAEFTVEGEAIVAISQPYRFYLLQRVHDIVEDLNPADRTEVADMLAACGMSDILTATLDRRLTRADNLEVWV